MRFSLIRRVFSLVVCIATVAVAATSAIARPDQVIYKWKVTLTVPAMVPQPDDVHLLFTGTGGSIKNAEYIMGPPIASITGASNMVDIVWHDKVPAATVIMFTFTTAHEPVGFGGGNWTNGGDDIGPVDGGSIQIERVGIPTVSEWGLIIMGLLLLSGGVVAMRVFASRAKAPQGA